MNPSRYLPVRLLLCAGLALAAAPAAPADSVVPPGADKPDLGLAYGSVPDVTRTDRPGFDEAAHVAMKRHGLNLLLGDVIARAPAPLTGGLPNAHYVRGQAVGMALRLGEIGVLIDAVGEGAGQEEVLNAAMAAAVAAGVPIAADGHSVVNAWARLRLAEPVDGAEAMNLAIEQMLKAPGVGGASPVFDNAFIEGGFYMPTERVMVRVRPGLDAAATIAALAGDFEIANPRLGDMPGAMTLRSTLRNGFSVMRRANELFESGSLAWSLPAALESMELHVTTPNDPNFNQQWVHRNTGQSYTDGAGTTWTGVTNRDMDTDLAWDITPGNAAVRILVMDTGTQTNHPDLSVFSGRNFTTGAANGTGDGSPGNSCDNHGTSVAGCAANIYNNATLEAGTAGACTIMGAKIGTQSSNPCGNAFAAYSSEWVVNALNWGRNNGAKVTNASFGVGQSDAIEEMYTSTWNSGLLHFASAGNGGSDSIGDNGAGFPGSVPETICVIALDPDGTKCGFSNFGTNCDLCSGGRWILAADRTDSAGYTNGNNVWFSGTSAASPVAAGVGLLFFSQHGFATPSQARTAIFNSCVDLGAAGIDITYRRGFINAFGALVENAPSNNQCTTPTVIAPTGGNVLFNQVINTAWATPSRLDPVSTCGGTNQQNTVFYRFTADHDGDVIINTFNSTYDTVLSVFDGCPTFDAAGVLTGSPNQIACNDDAVSTPQSQVAFSVVAGQTILIKVGKFGSTSGGGTLDFNFTFNFDVPVNDLCSNATTIADPETGNFTFNPPVYDAFHATTSACEPNETCGSLGGNGHSVYYRFTPEHSGTINLDTFGSSYDTVLSIHGFCAIPISGCIQPPHLACNDDAGGGLQSRIANFAVTKDQLYIIEVSSFGTTPAGILDFNFSYSRGIPASNNCDGAIVIPGNATPGSTVVHNPPVADVYYATTGQCDPDIACLRPAPTPLHTVWYQFAPQYNGTIDADTIGSNYDTVLLIQSGCAFVILQLPPNPPVCIGGGTTLACTDNIAANNFQSRIQNFRVTAGQTYYFMAAAKTALTPGTGAGLLDFNLAYTADTCAADFNGDGNLDPDDLSDYITCFFTAPPCPAADFNADGNIDPDDLSDYITAFFQGC